VAALVDRIVAETDAACVLLGAGGDRDVVSAIESRVGTGTTGGPPDPRLVSLVGHTDVAELMGLAAQCRAFVSNDSGAMHLAAALGVHVTAIFGPTDERATSPLGPHTVVTHDVWCRPCHLRDCPIDHRCMTRIPVETVFASVKAALDRAAGGARS
jgi:heptosyltransferase-2